VPAAFGLKTSTAIFFSTATRASRSVRPVIATPRSSKQSSSKLNNFLVGQLAYQYEYGEDAAIIWQLPDYYRKLDASMVQQAAKTYLNMDNRVRVTLLPEKK